MRSVPIRIHYITSLNSLHFSQGVRTLQLVQCWPFLVTARMKKKWMPAEVCSQKVGNLEENYVKPCTVLIVS